MSNYSQDYYNYMGGQDRQQPTPGDPEAAFYGDGGERIQWVDADGAPDAQAGYMPYGYARRPHTVAHHRGGWGKWLLIALLILFAIPLLKIALAVIVVASAALALLIGFVVFLALMVVGGVLVLRAVQVLLGGRHTRL